MKYLIQIGRVVQGVHNAMGKVGVPEIKIAEILDEPSDKLWDRIKAGKPFSLEEVDSISLHFGFSREKLMKLGEGNVMRPQSRAGQKRKRISSTHYRWFHISAR